MFQLQQQPWVVLIFKTAQLIADHGDALVSLDALPSVAEGLDEPRAVSRVQLAEFDHVLQALFQLYKAIIGLFLFLGKLLLNGVLQGVQLRFELLQAVALPRAFSSSKPRTASTSAAST